jgi:hypothetical protein
MKDFHINIEWHEYFYIFPQAITENVVKITAPPIPSPNGSMVENMANENQMGTICDKNGFKKGHINDNHAQWHLKEGE